MKVGVAMPWRPQPSRQIAHDYVCGWLGEVLPLSPIYEVDSHHEVYNLAAARNLGVDAAEADGCDVVVIIDADTVVAPAGHLVDAVRECVEDGLVHIPYSNVRYLDEVESVTLAAGGAVPLEGNFANGGCYVVTPATYRTIGGSDDRFSGWGGDDDQLVAAATCLAGLKRHAGVGLSFWHPAVRDIGSDRHRPNGVLAQRYWNAIDDPGAMRRLIAERAG